MERPGKLSLRDKTRVVPFPLGYALFAASFASMTRLAGGADAVGLMLTIAGVMVALAGLYLYRLHRIDEPKYQWLRDRLADEERARERGRRPRR